MGMWGAISQRGQIRRDRMLRLKRGAFYLALSTSAENAVSICYKSLSK
jgi:hypothetical protein